MLRLKRENKEKLISIQDLGEGEIGKIVEQPFGAGYAGYLVQRVSNIMERKWLILGKGDTFSGDCGHKVRVLEPGTEIIVG